MSILESVYIEPTRPYSNDELKDMETRLFSYLKLSDIKAYHTKCNHFYLVKQNGRKEKEIQEQSSNKNIGNCSVCWKLKSTPENLKDCAYNLIDEFYRVFTIDGDNKLTYDSFDLENVFYRWLYALDKSNN